MESKHPQNAAMNPYQPPAAEVLTAPSSDSPGSLITDGRAVAASQGMAWVTEGWRIFMQAPMIWVVMSVIFLALVMVLSLIPLLNIAVNLFIPVMMAGFVIGADHLRRGAPLEIGHLFGGLQRNFSSLVAVGAIYLGLLIAVMLVVGILAAILLSSGGGLSAFMRGRNMGALFSSGMMLKLMLIFLLMLAALVPAMMALWFAPALVVIHDVPAVNAMVMSFKGCLKNFLPFLVYGLIACVIMVIAMIPLGLGLLVAMPLMYTTLYASYRDIFIAQE